MAQRPSCPQLPQLAPLLAPAGSPSWRLRAAAWSHPPRAVRRPCPAGSCIHRSVRSGSAPPPPPLPR